MAEDTVEGPQDPSKRDFLKNLVKGAAVVGTAAVAGKLGYEVGQELGFIPEGVKVTHLSDLLLSPSEDPSKLDIHANKHLVTEGYLVRLSTEGKSFLGDSILYGLFPQKPNEADLSTTMEEYKTGANKGKFLPVLYFDNTLNQFFRGEKI